jgi:hypothetical protein
MQSACFWQRACLSILFSTALAATAHALDRKDLTVEVFPLPSFSGDLPARAFHGIGVDHSTGNISLANDQVWCEIPYERSQFFFSRAFVAPTQGFTLKAVASVPGDIYVFDERTNTIKGSHHDYSVDKPIKRATGMAYHKGAVFIADGYRDLIYKIRLREDQAEVVDSFYVPRGITGLASDGVFLYASQRDTIRKYDDFMELKGEYALGVFVSGLTYVGHQTFVATAEGKDKLYRFEL